MTLVKKSQPPQKPAPMTDDDSEPKANQNPETSDQSNVSADHCSAPLQKLWKAICDNKKALAGVAAAGLVGAGAYFCNDRQQSSTASNYLKAAGAIAGLGALGATAYYRNSRTPAPSSEDSDSSSACLNSKAWRTTRKVKLTKPSKKNEKSSNTLLICGVIVVFIILVVAWYAMMS